MRQDYRRERESRAPPQHLHGMTKVLQHLCTLQQETLAEFLNPDHLHAIAPVK